MSSAQDEFNRLYNHREKVSGHPEDQDHSDQDSNPPSDSEALQYSHSDSDDGYTSNNMASRSASYRVPNTVFDANTGPKGVITDAQAFERARKRSFRRTLLSVAGFDQSQPKFVKEDSTLLANTTPPDGSSDDEDSFMRKWRESRMQELQNQSSRRSSPRRRMYGSLEAVDAEGYLDAVEKSPAGTTVVVCIYDSESSASSLVEDCLTNIARKQLTTRFVKMDHEIAELDNIKPPALLAYRNGDVFATIVDVLNQFPTGRSCSAESLEDLLKLHRIL